VAFERFSEDGERQVALELGGPAGLRRVAAVFASAQDLADQGCLADPRLARDNDGSALAGVDGVEQPVESPELGITTDQRLSRPG
jgi:hypothetical protein